MLEILQYIGRAFLQAVDIFVCLIGRSKYAADARFNLGRNFYDIGKFLFDGIHTGSNLIGLRENRIKGTLDIRDLTCGLHFFFNQGFPVFLQAFRNLGDRL